MSLSMNQWVQLIFVDAPEFKTDVGTLTVAALAKKWIPRLKVYDFVPDADQAVAEIVPPHEAVKRIQSGTLGIGERVIIDRATQSFG